MPTEIIVAAAIQIDGLTMSLPRPARHVHVLRLAVNRSGEDSNVLIGREKQGFLTSAGRFVGRVEAKRIALAAGQPMIDRGQIAYRGPELFSGDWW